METIVKKLEDNKVEIAVTIPAELVDKKIAAIYKEASKTRIPGFRAGKAPRKVLENNYGGKEYFMIKATEELVKEQTPLAIDAEDFVPTESAEFGDEEINWVEEGKDFSFKFNVTVTPEYELNSYEPVTIVMPSAQATEAEIAEHLDSLIGYYTEYEPVTERAAQVGDIVTFANVDARIDGAIFEQMAQEKLPYEIGSKGLPDAFEEAVIGTNVGDEVTVEFSFDESFEGYEVGQIIVFKAKVEQISLKKEPELTDEWVKETLEYEGGVTELNERVTEMIESQKISESSSQKEYLVAQEVANRLEGEPTEALVKQIEQDLYQDLFRMLQSQNIMLDAYLAQRGLDSAGLRDDMQKQAHENAATALGYDAWARHIGIEVTDDEIFEEFVKSGSENPQSLFDNWQQNGRLSEIRQGIRRIKASKQANDTAVVIDPLAASFTEDEVAAKDAPAAEKKPAAKKKATKKADAEKPAAKKTATEKKPAATKKPATKKSTKKDTE